MRYVACTSEQGEFPEEKRKAPTQCERRSIVVGDFCELAALV